MCFILYHALKGRLGSLRMQGAVAGNRTVRNLVRSSKGKEQNRPRKTRSLFRRSVFSAPPAWEGLIHTQMSVLVASDVVLLAENNRIDDTAVALFDVEQTALGQEPEWFSGHVH